MSINEADQATSAPGVHSGAADQAASAPGVHSGAADQAASAAGGRSGVAAPLLRTLGDAGAAVCADGFCEIPQGPRAAPGPAATTGADE